MSTLVAAERLRLQVEVADWREAIRSSAELLLPDFVTSDYIDAIFESFATNGAYMILLPEVVLAHARPEKGALRTGISLVTLAEPVLYEGDENNPISVVFTFAATDATEHVALLQSLATILMDPESMAVLRGSTDVAEVQRVQTAP